jgi:tetratricopeptide (TPR) repeat protein
MSFSACIERAVLVAGLAIASLGLVNISVSRGQVKVWQGVFAIPVYDEGLPDVNPPFDIFSRIRFNYPYTLRTALTSRRQMRDLRALYLENEYLKCSVLPDLGGHLYSCTDKLSGQEMFYANPSIKKQIVGYRGAWAAFGIEFNFPVSHNWMSISPVDFAYRSNPDGSASVFVGNIDRPYGMQWTVELILRPGSTVLEERVTLYNRSDLRHRYYWWNNANVEITDDSKIVYPMRYSAGHGFTYVDTWPVNHEGRDLSVIRNHTGEFVSQFVHGSREPFMGVWSPHTRTGVVHYAAYGDLPGKKIWSLGVSPDALDFRRALADNNSGSVEVQAGLFRNQETYAFLPPQDRLQFSEYWMPVRNIGGISRANLEGVVYVRREAGKLVADLNVNRPIDDAVVRLRNGKTILAERRTDLHPDAVLTLETPNPPSERCSFEVIEAGRVLLAHTEDTYDWTPASEIRTGPQEPTPREHDPVEQGTALELRGRLLDAAVLYAAALEKDPDHFELNKAAGRLAVALKNFPVAERLLKRAQYRSSNDPEIHYYLGHVYAALGELPKAREEWEGAQRQPQLRAPARFMLARLAAQSGDQAGALRKLEQAMAEKPNMVRAGGAEITLLRKLGRLELARERLAFWRSEDPTNSFLRVEGVKLGTADEALWRHLAADPERVIEIAVDYIELGCYEDAIELLSRVYPTIDPQEADPGAPLPQNYPLVAYYRGYCRQKSNQPGSVDFTFGSKMPTRYVFPHRAMTLTVLRAALKSDPEDATAHFLLGSLYMSGGMVDSAMAEWETARRLNPRIPVLHRNLGRTLLVMKKYDRRALDIFQEGLGADPENIELYTGSNQILSILRRPVEDRLKILASYPDQEKLPTELAFDYALSLVEAGQFDRARQFFYDRYFERAEFGTNVRHVFLEVQVMEALSFAKSGRRVEARSAVARFGRKVEGLQFTADAMDQYLAEPRLEFYLGEIESLLDNPEAARSHWRKAAGAAWGAFAVLAARNLGESGWKERASRFAESAAGEPDSNGRYNRGIVLRALGREEEAVVSLDESLRQPDEDMSHYKARRALAGSDDTMLPQ